MLIPNIDFSTHVSTINSIIEHKEWEFKKEQIFPNNRLPILTTKNMYINNNTIFGRTVNGLPEESDVWDFLEKHQKPGYKVAIFDLDLDNIYYTLNLNYVLSIIQNYFKTYNSGLSDEEALNELRYDNHSTKAHEIKQNLIYIKFCTLTMDYITNNFKFNYPVTAHFLYDAKKWRLHPGGFRQVIFGLFGKEPETVIGLIHPDYDLKVLKEISSCVDILDYFKLSYEDTQLNMALQGFGDRFLPNFSFDYDGYHNKFTDEYLNLVEFFDSINIYTNFHFEHKSRNQDKVKREVFVTVENNRDLALICKVLLVLPLIGTSYFNSIEGVKVHEINNTTI